MHIFPFLVVVWILAVGLYGVVTSRHLVHQIVCLIVVQSSTYVLLLGVGYVTGAVAPYCYDVPVHTPAVDPVVQALALTDVVVEGAVTALLLAFAIQAHSGSAPSIRKSSPTSRAEDATAVDQLLALVIVIPLLGAAGVSGLTPVFRTHRRALDTVAIAAAACVTVLLVVITARAAHGGLQVYWFAGFRPRHGIAIGIDFAVDPLSAGLASLAALLVTAAMIFSWRYFDRVETYFHAMMLTFLAGLVGFCLTGDIFDLFVWFELMGVSAYALTAYRPEERAPIQGALNFAITSSIGAYLWLSGIGLIYGRTGALNMARSAST